MSPGIAVGRTLVTKGCTSCQITLLRSFVSLAIPTTRSSQSVLYPSRYIGIDASRQLRHSSQSPYNRQEIEPKIIEESAPEQAAALQEDLKGQEEFSEETQVAAVPWYLQVDTPQRAVLPLSERQKIPELPDAPPPILAPLLHRISIELGLDDLSLLDLRKLDPPPALGANLLMLIGTARSEKHLHVSADRLCRWLRSEYKLRPSADGLLGRNELKLKLRRKAKRAKLVGSPEDNFDDGIRTGWVCIDIGVVQVAEGAAPESIAQDFIGFGRRTEGVRLVVQMLTEEKREEIELEKLWSGILKRGGQHEIEESQDTAVDEALESNVSRMRRQGSLSKTSSIIQQSRGFHTTIRGPQTLEERKPDLQGAASAGPILSVDEIRQKAMMFLASRDDQTRFEQARDLFLHHSAHVPELAGDRWRPYLLDVLRSYIQDLPVEDSGPLFGTGDTDHDSTNFLGIFYGSFPAFMSPFEAETKIWLACHAHEIGHPGYTIEGLRERFADIQSRGINITLETYMYLLRALLTPDRNSLNYRGPPPHATHFATEVLYTMHNQGHEVLSEDMLVSLQELISPDVPPEQVRRGAQRNDSETFGFISLPMHPMQQRFHALIRTLDFPLFQDESRIRLMNIYARGEHWLEFFQIFRMAPQHNKPQSALMYIHLFSTVASTNHQRACQTVLRAWIPELDKEKPSVELEGEIADAVRACLLVAEPDVQHESEADPVMKPNAEWIRLWRRLLPRQ